MDVSTDIFVDDLDLHDLTVCADGHGIDGIIQHEAGGLFDLTDIPSAVRDALKSKTTVLCGNGSHQSVFLCKLAVIRAEQSNQRTAESTTVFIDLLAGNRTVDQIIFDCLAVVSGNLYNCRILTGIRKGYGILGIGELVVTVGGKLLHIVASKRKVGLNLCCSVLIQRDDLNKTFCGNGSAAGRYDFLGCKQPKGNVFHFTVCANAEVLIMLDGLYKADLHLLTLVLERSRRFGNSNILTGIDKLDAVGFRVEHHPVGCCDLTHLIFAKIEFTAHRCAGYIGCNRVHDLALLISDSAVLRDNILCGDDLIDRTGKSTLFILRLIDGGQFVSAFIYAADDGNAEEHLAGFFHGDGAFLCHIGLIHFYYRNPAFFCGIILRDIEVHGCFVEDIAVGSLYLDNRVPFSKGQLFRRDKRTFCIGVEHINGGGRRVSEGHRHGIAVRVINLEACTGVRNGLSGFCVLLHDLDEAVKGGIVDKVAISRPILRNEHIKVGHQLAALPAGYLMDGVDAVRHILGLCKAVFVTGEIITLGSLCAIIGACDFQIHGKLSTIFGCFDLRITVIGVLDDGDVALYDLLSYIICRLIMLHGIELRLCADLMDGGIKQITLRGSDLTHHPVIIADIFLGDELSVLVGGVGIHKGFALIDAVNSTGKRSITLRRAGFGIALGNGHGKLLQNIEETTVRDLVPADRRRLRFGNDIANGGVHFLHRIRRRSGNEDIFKGRHAVFIGHGILVHGNAGE